jgi:DNA-binding transcriptional regulator YiaG
MLKETELLSFENVEMLREKLGWERKTMCRVLGVSMRGYCYWRKRGVPETALQLLRVLRKRPDVVIPILLWNQGITSSRPQAEASPE